MSRLAAIPRFAGVEIETPALIVDLDSLEQNIRTMAESMKQFPGVRVRSHAKAHKCPEIAHLQMKYLGESLASGVCCQKTCEAEVMIKGGIKDVLLSNEVVQTSKMERLVQLAKSQDCRFSVCVDDASNAEDWSKVAGTLGYTVDVLVEYDVGQYRCGVITVDDAVALVKKVSSLPGLRFMGLQAYHGAAQHIRSFEDRSKTIACVVSKVKQVLSALEAEGLACPVISGGGTGTYPFEAGSGVYTEVQPGSYVFNDVDYSKNLDAAGNVVGRGVWKQSLFVLSTVMSRSDKKNSAIVDAGTKAVSLDSGAPVVRSIGTHEIEGGPQHEELPVQYISGGDEHGVVWFGDHISSPVEGLRMLQENRIPARSAELFRDTRIGMPVLLEPGHCDPTVNLYDKIYAMRQGVVEAVWTLARSPGV